MKTEDLNSTESRKYPDSILSCFILPLQTYNFNQAFRFRKFRRRALDMASPRQRPKRIIKDGIKATTHQQAGSCNNVNNTIKTSDIFLGGNVLGNGGQQCWSCEETKHWSYVLWSSYPPQNRRYIPDNCLQEGKAIGTHDTSWYHAGEMGLQKDVSLVKSSFSRLAFKQKLYKRGMILWLLLAWSSCGTTAVTWKQMKICAAELQCDHSCEAPLASVQSHTVLFHQTRDVVPSHWRWNIGETNCMWLTHSPSHPSHLDMSNAAWTHCTIGACNICALLQCHKVPSIKCHVQHV